MSGCAGCGSPLAPSGGNRPRKWCSERCRKGSYGDPCVGCGMRTVYGAEAARVPEPRCAPCRIRHDQDRRVASVLAMVDLRQSAGLTNVEIGHRLGISVLTVRTELHRMRALGFGVPASPYHAARVGDHPLVWDRSVHTLAAALAERGHDVPALREERAA